MDEFFQLLRDELFGFDSIELNETLLLKDLPQWDSLARLNFISIVDEHYHREVTGGDLMDCSSLGELYRLIRPSC